MHKAIFSRQQYLIHNTICSRSKHNAIFRQHIFKCKFYFHATRLISYNNLWLFSILSWFSQPAIYSKFLTIITKLLIIKLSHQVTHPSTQFNFQTIDSSSSSLLRTLTFPYIMTICFHSYAICTDQFLQ